MYRSYTHKSTKFGYRFWHLSITSHQDTNCHHQIVYYKLNLNIKFPPPYEPLVWNYNKADTEKIKTKVELFVIIVNCFQLKLQIAIKNVSEIIDQRKNDYNCHLASKLNNPKASAKTYWSILKSFYSSKKV